MRALVRIVVGFSLAAGLQWAASWDSVTALRTGQKVRIETAESKVTGLLSAATAETVTIQSETSGHVSVPRMKVRRVYVENKGRRVWKILIGTAVGAAAGIALYGTIGQLYRNEGAGSGHLLTIPIAAGAAAGAVLPARGMKRIYDAGP